MLKKHKRVSKSIDELCADFRVELERFVKNPSGLIHRYKISVGLTGETKSGTLHCGRNWTEELKPETGIYGD